MYGVAVTPALFAALTWRRATWQGGLASIVGGARGDGVLRVRAAVARARACWRGRRAGATTSAKDPWGIPSIYPAAIISIGLLVVVSLVTPAPKPEELERLFGKAEKAA